MKVDCIPFRDTHYVSDLICDYFEQKENVRPLYHRFPSLSNFEAQIREKQQSFSDDTRSVLVQSLQRQYEGFEVSDATQLHITKLAETSTFTVTTGHQLNLFTGPLYFLYKIISTLNLAKQLQETYPKYHFVPVYWMATEDHDFEEIQYFKYKNQKIQWNREAGGAVGDLETSGLEEVTNAFESVLGPGENAKYLVELFRKGYTEHTTLQAATRYIANELFGKKGLVILDAHQPELKRLFIPAIENDLFRKTAYTQVTEQNNILEQHGYRVQVTPREINLFYLQKQLRNRIIEQEGQFFVDGTDISWTREQLQKEVQGNPERFSPNVIMRPLYQETILPNLCYIGGGGELAYWLQLKSYFEASKQPFPILLLRDTLVLITDKQVRKLEKLNLELADLFLSEHELKVKKTKELSEIPIDFSPQKKHLQRQFEDLYELAKKTDVTFLNAVKSQEVKQIKGLKKLEKRLLKAQQRNLSDQTERSVALQSALFPNGNLQERTQNFSAFYETFGKQLINDLIRHLDPLQLCFKIIQLTHTEDAENIAAVQAANH